MYSLVQENKITESMKISGMSTAAMWISWLISYGSFNTVIVLLIVLVTWVGDLLASSNSFLVFLFYFAFMWSCMLFSFLLSSFFSKSRTGGAVGMLGYLILSTPSYAFTGGAGSSGSMGLACLLPPTAFSLGNAILTEAERVEQVGQAASGIQFSNFFDSKVTSINISFGAVFLILILDLFILGVLAWYCDKVVPTGM
jgi:ATP-binding cassette subfamily A (ABC1) protein 3